MAEVEAGFASSQVQAHNPLAAAYRFGHEPAGGEDLVVGVSPDPKNRLHVPIPSCSSCLVRPVGHPELIAATAFNWRSVPLGNRNGSPNRGKSHSTSRKKLMP